ncbi:YqaJ viral recombinase family protein (plasmid) [Latilactobacillus curvatus]|uniref:YqaJ viral recombinase family nuclease n=1 Tax=Latilactobacillus curvatus TaxID=28038 RepID=UPI0024B915B0|nr:YqaJ viral recombinase family protein [Latilactobacillus curvatus]WHQ77645.1 YqaJ viral recombinase family protein [Latilactobacillus curvatus]WHQ79259.1 YqaJ viral recombinase family protein [Latilactobacillus curvatus]
MKSINTANMSRLEWLEHRRSGIGGSDVAAILGLSKWRSPYSVWADKTGKFPVDDSGNEFTHWGNVMEPILAKEFESVTGKKVYRQNKTFIHPKYDFLRADIDRDIANEDGFLEIKTAMEYKSDEWSDDKVPIAYQLQVQHYMNVLGREYCYFAALIGGHKFVVKKVERDQGAIDMIESKLVTWWHDYVETDTPPDVDGDASTTAALRAMYPDEDGEIIALPSSFNERLERRNFLKNVQKEYDRDISQVENEIRLALGEASGGQTDKFRITNHANKRGTKILRIKEI